MRLPHSRWISGRRAAVLVGIPGKQHQVDLFRNGRIDDHIQCAQEIQDAQRQAADGVMPPVVGHIDMRVGEVQDLDHQAVLGMSRLARMLTPVPSTFSRTTSFMRTGALIFVSRSLVINSGMRGLGKASEV